MKAKLLTACIVLSVFFSSAPAEAKTKPYYTGEALSYNGMVIFGTTDMGILELFKVKDGRTEKAGVIRSYGNYSANPTVYGAAFKEEDGRAMAYLVDSKYIFKYDISNPDLPVFIKKEIPARWDYWYMGVRVAGDKIYAIGSDGIKVWSKDLTILNEYKLSISNFYNVTISQNGKYIINSEGDRIKVYDTGSRSYVSEFSIKIKESRNRKVYSDPATGRVFVAGDGSLYSFNIDGTDKKEIKHLAAAGYDVDGLANSPYLYYTDGMGIVKFDKRTLKPVSWKFTKDLKAGSKGWMMGLKVANSQSNDIIIAFSDSGIIVLDGNYKELGFIPAAYDNFGPYEKLSLRADKTRAPRGAEILVSGRGFMQSEPVEITLDNKRYYVRCGLDGSFSSIIKITEETSNKIHPLPTDIIVKGEYSNQKLNLGFVIE